MILLTTQSGPLTIEQQEALSKALSVTVDGIYYQSKDATTSSGFQLVSLKNSIIPPQYHLLSAFEKIVFIGDSLTAGYTNYKHPSGELTSSVNARKANRNWPYYLALRNGREDTWINMGYGSTKASHWRNKSTQLFPDIPDGDGLRVAMSYTQTQIYNIALGFNDRGDTLGNAGDIDLNNPENNAATYCGNLGYIISKLLTVNTTCRIVIMTMPNIPGKVSIPTANNKAIMDVVAKFGPTGRVYCLDLTSYDNYYNNPILTTTFNGHSFPMGYEYMSYIIERAYEDMLMTNFNGFAYLPLLS